MMEGLFLFDTASSPIFCGSPRLDTLLGDDGVLNAEGGGQESEYGKERDAGDASYKTGYSEKDVQGLQAFSWSLDRTLQWTVYLNLLQPLYAKGE